jgi:chromosome segregation ATPase
VIEAALDGRDQWLVTSDSAAAAAAAGAGRSGRARHVFVRGFAGRQWTDSGNHAGAAGAGLVRFDPADAAIAGSLLGRTLVVDDLASAMDLRRAGPAGFGM